MLKKVSTPGSDSNRDLNVAHFIELKEMNKFNLANSRPRLRWSELTSATN